MIAGGFFRSGMIGIWGRGIQKIMTPCREESKPDPVFDVSDTDVMITFINDRPQQKSNGTLNNCGVTREGTAKSGCWIAKQT